MTGLLGVPQSFVDDMNERLQDEVSDSRDDNLSDLVQARRLGEEADFGYFGVSDPVLCLPLGSTVAWHVRPKPNPIYPVYLRSNLLNTNQHFDYGAFRAAALLPQLRTSETLAAISARLPTTVQTSDWSIFAIVFVTVLVVVGLLFVTTWTLTRQNLAGLEPNFTSHGSEPSEEPAMCTVDMTDLVLQKQPARAVKEDPAVVRARRALVKRLKAQDPRLFIAVLNMCKEIQQKVEEQCELIAKERTHGLTNLVEQTKHLNEAFISTLRNITTSEADTGEPLAIDDVDGLWSRERSAFSHILLPAIGESGQAQLASKKLSAEQQMGGLIEEFRRARDDADDNLAEVMEIYKAKLRSLLEILMKNSALLELDASRARLEECEDEAEESRAVATYRIVGSRTEAAQGRAKILPLCIGWWLMSNAAHGLKKYTAILMREISACIHTAHKAFLDTKAAIIAEKLSAEEAATALKGTIVLTAEEGKVRIKAAASEVADTLSKAEVGAAAESSSWADEFGPRLLELHDDVMMTQNNAFTFVFASESRILSSSIQNTKSLILDHIRTRYEKTLARRRAELLEEMNVLMNASVSEAGRRKQQKLSDGLLEKSWNRQPLYLKKAPDLIRTKPEDLSSADALVEEMMLQQTATFASHREQLQAALKGERQAAVDEAWDLISRARKDIQEELADLSEELAQAKTRLAEATIKEESSRESYATALFDIAQQQERGLKELQIDHELAVFKQKLFSGMDSLLMTRAAEIRNRGNEDAEGDEWLQKEWKVAQAEFEPLLIRERERYRQVVDMACKEQKANELQVLMEGRDRQRHQIALMGSLEQGEVELCRKRVEFGMSEIQRIIWRFCNPLPLRDFSDDSLDKRSEALAGDDEGEEDEAINELKAKLRRRRKRQVEYCMAHRRLVESRSRGVLKALQEETLQWTSETGETSQSLSRVSAMLDAAEASADTLALVEQAHQRLEESLRQLQREHEVRVELHSASILSFRNPEADCTCCKLVRNSNTDVLRQDLRCEVSYSSFCCHQEAEERERLRLEEERVSRIKAHEEAKQQLTAEHEARMAVADDDTKQHLLQEGGTHKHFHRNLLAAKGRAVAELQERLLAEAQAIDDRNTLQRQALESQQAEELEKLLKRIEQRARMLQDGEMLQLSEEEQYAQLRKEAESAAEKQVVLLEERMLEQQQQFIREMEEKRQVYDKWLSRMRHRKEAEEQRKALQATHAQLQQQGRQWQEDGLKNLMAQYDTDRQQLEAALIVEAERQHKCAQRKKMSRNAERGARLQQKRLIEKERFLAFQSPFASSLLRSERMLQLKAPQVRRIFEGIQKISRLVALVKSAAALDAAVEEDELTQKEKLTLDFSSSSSSSEHSSDSGTQSGTEDSANSSLSDSPDVRDSSSESDASSVGSKASDSEISDSESSEDSDISGSDSDSSDSD
ncbi:hypothetical protein ACSSS7_002809 [Eimeria intestinalis]